MNGRREIKPRRISPRLLSGDSRATFGHGLPQSIKDGLFEIARRENMSVAWVLENVIIDYFHLERPEYKTRAGEKPRKAEHIPRKFTL